MAARRTRGFAAANAAAPATTQAASGMSGCVDPESNTRGGLLSCGFADTAPGTVVTAGAAVVSTTEICTVLSPGGTGCGAVGRTPPVFELVGAELPLPSPPAAGGCGTACPGTVTIGVPLPSPGPGPILEPTCGPPDPAPSAPAVGAGVFVVGWKVLVGTEIHGRSAADRQHRGGQQPGAEATARCSVTPQARFSRRRPF